MIPAVQPSGTPRRLSSSSFEADTALCRALFSRAKGEDAKFQSSAEKQRAERTVVFPDQCKIENIAGLTARGGGRDLVDGKIGPMQA